MNDQSNDKRFLVPSFIACLIRPETRNSRHETFSGWFHERRETR